MLHNPIDNPLFLPVLKTVGAMFIAALAARSLAS